MPFHRLILPTYFGGLPGGYDYVNDPAANGDIGAPAQAEAKKSGGPNDGTYFVAFQEPGTSAITNRGLRALAENTDQLDDYFHRDLATPTISPAITPGAPLASAIVPGNVFVGAVGATNDQRTRSGLVAVLDGDGLPLHVLSGAVYAPVLAQLIHDGASNNVVGVTASGFYTNPTVTFTTPISAGQSYRFSYAVRDSLAAQTAQVLTRLAQGTRGNEDLWAYAKTTRLGAVTFAGSKVFDDAVTLDDTGTFNAPTLFVDDLTISADILLDGSLTRTAASLAVPLLSSQVPPGGDQYVLLGEFQLVPGRKSRIYASDQLASSREGIVLTSNARWNYGTLSWDADDPLVGAAKFTVSPEGSGFQLKTVPAVTWGDGAWDSDVSIYPSLPTGFQSTEGFESAGTVVGQTGVGSGAAVVATTSFSYAAPVPIKKSVSVLHAIPQENPAAEWLAINSGSRWQLQSVANAGEVAVPIVVPAGIGTITVRVIVDPGAARVGANRVYLELKKTSQDFSVPTANVDTVLDGAFDDGTAGLQVVTLTAAVGAVDSAAFFVAITAGNTGASQIDHVYGIELEYTQSNIELLISG